MKVRKAVIVAAGLGTRMLPASKVIPKEILPVVDTPAIQIMVEEAIASGIEEIMIVISPGKDDRARSFQTTRNSSAISKSAASTTCSRSSAQTNNPARITIADQPQPLGLGHAVLQAREAVGDEPFAVILPDDIFDSRGLPAPIARCRGEHDAPVVALLQGRAQRDFEVRHRRGEAAGDRALRIDRDGRKAGDRKSAERIRDHGALRAAAGDFRLLAEGKPGAGGEIQLTDALLALAKRRKIYGYEFEGTRYDLGDRVGFITAQIGFGLKRPEVADRLRAYLKSVISQAVIAS